jgi:hypothetical protein
MFLLIEREFNDGKLGKEVIYKVGSLRKAYRVAKAVCGTDDEFELISSYPLAVLRLREGKRVKVCQSSARVFYVSNLVYNDKGEAESNFEKVVS